MFPINGKNPRGIDLAMKKDKAATMYNLYNNAAETAGTLAVGGVSIYNRHKK